MIALYSVEEAKKSILRRIPLQQEAYSPILLSRTETLFGAGVTPPEAVQIILRTVAEEGDLALRRWSSLLDNFNEDKLIITAGEMDAAWNSLPWEVQEAMRNSSQRIRTFHQNQPVTNWLTNSMGGELGQRFTPLARVGVYVPGGTAPLPSSLLMSVVPAQVAGTKNFVVCTPPPVHPTILAAAHICGLNSIIQIGGAQAIAAMAFGTKSVPRVDKIVGAGNLFVTLAKQQLYGIVGIDGLAGPTETMVIADGSANPVWLAADLLAQAEHDVQASAILLTPDRILAQEVQIQVQKQLSNLSRKEIIASSLHNRGGIVLTESIEEAAALANEYAAEHLCLSVQDPYSLLDRINNAGGFFVGEHSFEVLGDYAAGPSHIMPTSGTARFASPLNVLDFVKISSIIALDPETARQLSPIAACLAEREQLTAHAAAAQARMEESK